MLKIKLVQCNGYAAFVGLVLLLTLFIGYYAMMRPFAITEAKLNPESRYTVYLSESDCLANGGFWWSSSCHALPERASGLMTKIKFYWLTAGIVLAAGIILWVVFKALKNDPIFYEQMPPNYGGGGY